MLSRSSKAKRPAAARRSGFNGILGQALALGLAPGLASILLGQSAGKKDDPAALAESGVVEGIVTYVGELPKSPVADNAGVHRNLLEVDPNSHGLRYVVVHVAPMVGAALQKSATAVQAPARDKPFTVDQQDLAFTPRVAAVQAGEPVAFTNTDPANHNVRTSATDKKNVFNVVTGIDGKYLHRFAEEPQGQPVRLGCDIHPWMRGWIYVFDHPHFAVTDERGRFRIGGVPPGRYKLTLRQPDIRYALERDVTVSAGPATKVDVEVRRGRIARSDEGP